MNCIIIHGCPSDKEKAINPETRNHDKHWIPWTKKELEKNGIKTDTPLMPEPWEPNYEKFKEEFEKYNVNEDSILIGHSCGTAFLVKWLGKSKKKIKKLILVAPWKIPDRGGDARIKFYRYPIDETIKDRVEEIIYFTADDEAEDGKKSLKMFKEILGGKVISINGYGHYIERHMHTTEFPELIREIISS